MPRIDGSPIYRFFSKINFDGAKILETPCWEWMGAVNHEGYGQIWIDQRTVRCCRFMLELKHPGLAKDLLTRHLCDNTRCVNPDHVVPGTHLDNSRDITERKRRRKTEKRYPPEMAKQIIAEASQPGVTRISISRKYGIGMRTLRSMMRGERQKDAQYDGEEGSQNGG